MREVPQTSDDSIFAHGDLIGDLSPMSDHESSPFRYQQHVPTGHCLLMKDPDTLGRQSSLIFTPHATAVPNCLSSYPSCRLTLVSTGCLHRFTYSHIY